MNLLPGSILRNVILFLPLILVIGGSFKKERHEPDDGLFADQRWSYQDVAWIFVLFTSTAFLGFLPGLRTAPVLVQWAVVFSVQAIVTLVAVYAVLRFRYRLPFSTLGFGKRNALYHTAWALKIVFAVLFVFWLLAFPALAPVPSRLLTLPGPPIPDSNLDRLFHQPPLYQFAAVVWFLDAILVLPMMEEVLFRGFVYTPFFRKFGAIGAAVLSTVMWSSQHSYHLGRMIFTLFTGLIFMYLYHRAQSLFPSLVFHAAGNSIIFLITLLRDLQEAGVLVLPAIIGSFMLFLVCRTLVQRVRPSLAEDRLPWS